MLKLKLTLAFLSLILTLTPVNKAQAQNLSLSLYPPLLEVMIQPGKSITQVYKLTNDSETELAMVSKIVLFEPKDEKGNVCLLSSELSSQLADWLSFQNADLDLEDKFVLRAGQEQEIVLKIKVPEKAAENDYYLTLLFETIPGVFIGNQSAVQAQAKIGTNILLSVSKDGKPPKKTEIAEFRGPKIIDSFDKPQFTLRIKNTGRAFFKPMGTIITTGWLGQKYLLDLLPENVLANSVRALKCANPDSPDELGPCQLNSRFLVGRYQAKVEFGLDQLNNDYSAETAFFALPIKLILGLIIVSAVIWAIKSKQDLTKAFYSS